jgi:hypothetical protein
MAAGVISGVRQTGSLLGLAAAGAAFAAAGGASFASGASGVVPSDFLDGLRAAMLVTVGCCLGGALAATWAGPRRAPAVNAPASAPR